MEVHPPEHPIHTWRDFFIHIATIVVGLLIAIGLEQSVERLHHVHQIHVARERIHEELEVDDRIVKENQRHTAQIVANLDRAMASLRILEHAPHQPVPPLEFGWNLQLLYKAAYDRATETGVLALLPYEESAMYADTYSGVDMTSKLIYELVDKLDEGRAAMRGHDAGSLSQAEIETVLSATSSAREKAGELQLLWGVYAEEVKASLNGKYRTDFNAMNP